VRAAGGRDASKEDWKCEIGGAEEEEVQFERLTIERGIVGCVVKKWVQDGGQLLLLTGQEREINRQLAVGLKTT